MRHMTRWNTGKKWNFFLSQLQFLKKLLSDSFRIRAYSWSHSGRTVDAQWSHSGCTVVAQWSHSDGTVVAQWSPSGPTVVAQLSHSGHTMVAQWSHSGRTMQIITLMGLPLSLNLQPQKCFLLKSVRFQPVIPNSAQHLHFLQEFWIVAPFAVGYFDLTASIHCLAVTLFDIHLSDDPGPPIPFPFSHLDTNSGLSS